MHRFSRLGWLAFMFCLSISPRVSLGEEPHARTLFRFDRSDAVRSWRTVNDGVMGGMSDGRVRWSDERYLEFSGTLSLENNGGFASVRSERSPLGLRPGDTLVARVKGDGRSYFWNLYIPVRRTAFSFRAPFTTRAGEWIEVRAPVEKFYATSYGRRVPDRPIKPATVDGIGILLADKQAGRFSLEVEWITVESATRSAHSPDR